MNIEDALAIFRVHDDMDLFAAAACLVKEAYSEGCYDAAPDEGFCAVLDRLVTDANSVVLSRLSEQQRGVVALQGETT